MIRVIIPNALMYDNRDNTLCFQRVDLIAINSQNQGFGMTKSEKKKRRSGSTQNVTLKRFKKKKKTCKLLREKKITIKLYP